jgi:hypothetical protein
VARSIPELTELDSFLFAVTPQNQRLIDDIYLSFHLDRKQPIEFSGEVSANAATTLLRYLTRAIAEFW